MFHSLDDIIATFASVDEPMRLELLLDFAKKLPPLPDRLRALRDAGFNRLEECMTPVFMFIEPNDRTPGRVRVHIDVAPESPTVAGVASILVRSLDGQPPKAFEAVPGDLVERLGLANQIRMTRAVGLSALVARVKREGARAAEAAQSL